MFGLFKRKNNELPRTLEAQLEILAKLGLHLEEEAGIDDLLQAFGREEYEQSPFALLLLVLGFEIESEPWGRPICSAAWNFDTEFINETGDYAEITTCLCRVAQKPGHLQQVRDFVDVTGRKAWLEYTVSGVQRHWDLDVNNDWADVTGLAYVMADIESDGRRFYFIDNGQAMVLYFLDAATAAELNRLSKGVLSPVLPD